MTQDGREFFGSHDEVGRGGGADENVSLAESILPFLEMHCGTAYLISEVACALMVAIGNKHRADAARIEATRHAFARLACAEDHDLVVEEVAENFFSEVHGDGSDGGRAARDGGFGTNLLGGLERALEELVQAGIDGSGIGGRCVGLFDLAENFGFAEDHGIETAGYAEEVLGSRCGIGGSKRKVGQEAGEIRQGGLGIGGGGVKFHAVAGREQNRALEALDRTDAREGFRKAVRTHGEFFAHLERGVAVADADADEGHQAGLQWSGFADM